MTTIRVKKVAKNVSGKNTLVIKSDRGDKTYKPDEWDGVVIWNENLIYLYKNGDGLPWKVRGNPKAFLKSN